jgi:predicted nucleotidyltransferase
LASARALSRSATSLENAGAAENHDVSTLNHVNPRGSKHHAALIDEVAAFYAGDERIRAVVVFGSVGAGTWHELSDVDLDVVVADDAAVVPRAEVEALFGARAAVVVAKEDSADIVLDTLEEISIRWHPLATTSPNIAATLRVVAGNLTDAEVRAAGDANRRAADRERLLDVLVRAAVEAAKAIERDRSWSAVVAVQEMRHVLTSLRGHRDELHLDPSDPAGALLAVLAETRAEFELGRGRTALLDRLGLGRPS